MHDLSRQLRALALLLDYPSEAMQTHLADLASVLGALEPVQPAARESLRGLIEHMTAADLMDLQAEFVDTFDRGRSTSLNLFEQVHGDSRDRGQAMVDLLAQYQEVGLDLQAKELPDYLPVYLEYCSVLDPSAAREALEEVALLVAHLTVALDRRESPWVAVTAAVCRLCGVNDWRALVEQQTGQGTRPPTPGPRDIQKEGLPADWTPAGLDAVWAEEPVDFLGACNPQQAKPSVQTVQFMPRAAQPHSAGV
ncbi:nitrate reductase molybdenum cofactor assembly chaperone [Thiomonas arsenitoxydans]|jgi:nitrate reductase delta subunit|uniref:nitrate reductase molybdenum cofactor assembly chaperone n=1 Tax=Thiomonas arsenitoxydans (strain DSM 22701 / CIP 110005 / 3As) TaxID=426114 RepID=UPI001AD3F85D|nr:nitrate reductase molybdenum cofactor assembly chaperone [Thiomonas arsenitoxydans]MBN8776539.1 nitrate reductase molybdenum cofactor assembly chaperone [Thiomonas arsenitoxydans]